MAEEHKKIKLPLELEVKDEINSGETLKLERKTFMYKSINHLSRTTTIAINDLHVRTDTNGKVLTIEGTGVSSNYIFNSFHLPDEYVIDEIHISLFPKTSIRGYKEECNWFKEFLNNFDIETNENSDDGPINFKSINEAIKENTTFVLNCESDESPFINMPINKKFFNNLVSEISKKNIPKIMFDIVLVNAYKLTSEHKGHYLKSKYLYLLESDESYSTRGIALYPQIYLSHKKDFNFNYPETKKTYVGKSNSEETEIQKIEHSADNTNGKILSHLRDINKKTNESHKVILWGLIIIIVLLVGNQI